MHEVKLKSWLIWFTAGLFYLFEFIHRIIVSVMVPELSKTFKVGSAMLSSLSAAYFFAYALAQVPVGMLIDRYGTRILLTFACLAITLSSFAFAYTESLLLANYCRIIIGLGSAFAFVGCLKLAATWFPAHRFAFIVGLTNLLGVIGAIIGGAPTAYAVQEYGWRNIMYVSGFIGLLLSLLLWNVVRDTNKDRHAHKHSNKIKPLTSLREVMQSRKTWIIALFAGCMVAPIVTYSELWGVTVLGHVYQLDRESAANVISLTFIGIAIGGPTIGWLSDHYRNRTYFMGMGVVGALVSICLILFGPIMPIRLLMLLHIIFGFFTSSMLLCFTLNSEETKPKVRATTVAFTNCIVMFSGAGLQIISGFLLDYTVNNFTTSFIPLISCYVVAVICLYSIQEPPCRFVEE